MFWAFFIRQTLNIVSQRVWYTEDFLSAWFYYFLQIRFFLCTLNCWVRKSSTSSPSTTFDIRFYLCKKIVNSGHATRGIVVGAHRRILSSKFLYGQLTGIHLPVKHSTFTLPGLVLAMCCCTVSLLRALSSLITINLVKLQKGRVLLCNFMQHSSGKLIILYI